MTHLYRLLGKNVARFRHRAKLTQEELAEKTGYSVDFIGLAERGVNAPTVARLKRYCRRRWRGSLATAVPTKQWFADQEARYG